MLSKLRVPDSRNGLTQLVQNAKGDTRVKIRNQKALVVPKEKRCSEEHSDDEVAAAADGDRTARAATIALPNALDSLRCQTQQSVGPFVPTQGLRYV